MTISIQDVIRSVYQSGVVESPSAQSLLEHSLSPFVGRQLNASEIFRDLVSEGAWTQDAQIRILSILQAFEGQVLHSDRTSIHERLCSEILNDTSRWNLTDQQKQEIVQDLAIMRRWAGEYSENAGFSALLDHVVDDEIAEWKQAHPEKPTLDHMIHFAGQRKATDTTKDMFIGLIANEDRTWSAVISASKSNVVPLAVEQSYPVDVYFERTDMNGSGVMERETCSNREELLSLLNWVGKAGFLPMEFWGFDIDDVTDQRVVDIFQGGLSRRYEVIEKTISSFSSDDAEPKSHQGKNPEYER